MQDITALRSFSVLDPDRLDQDVFADLPTAPALPTLQDLGPTLPEPHASWMTPQTQE